VDSRCLVFGIVEAIGVGSQGGLRKFRGMGLLVPSGGLEPERLLCLLVMLSNYINFEGAWSISKNFYDVLN